jgi:hypothetical protein
LCAGHAREFEHPKGHLPNGSVQARDKNIGRVASWIPAFAGMTQGALGHLVFLTYQTAAHAQGAGNDVQLN